MGAPRIEAVSGDIEVSKIPPNIVLCVARGHLSRAHALAAQAQIERIEAEIGGPIDSLFDGSAIESFEAGLPMLWVSWSRSRPAQHSRVAIVGRGGPMLSIASTFRYLLPNLRLGLFVNRRDALAFLME